MGQFPLHAFDLDRVAGRGRGGVGAAVGVGSLYLAGYADAANATAEEIKSKGGQAFAVAMNVTDEDQVEKGVADTIAKYGKVDILVSNAGIGVGAPTIVEMTLADWRRQTAINLDGVFLSVKHCIPAMRRSGGCSAPPRRRR